MNAEMNDELSAAGQWHSSFILHPSSSTPVSLGDTFALASGLMEITYDTGAKVILQGPVTYEVESAAGGYLSLGKLTARLEKKAEGGRRKTQIPDLIPNPSFIHYPLFLFAVRTPTAVVTDLGTEFGVEVDQAGNTTSHVFRGSVKLQFLDPDAEKQGNAIVLMRMNHPKPSRAHPPAALGSSCVASASIPRLFVRRLAQAPKALDLLDIVAGGNGTGHCRERGIDPTTGMEDPRSSGPPQRRPAYRPRVAQADRRRIRSQR